MSRGMRSIRRVAVVVGAAWFLTLGISIGRYDEAAVLNGGPDWDDFGSGKSPIHVGAMIESGPETSFGVPYIFVYWSQGLGNAILVFSVAGDSNPGRITYGVAASEISDRNTVLYHREMRTVSVDWDSAQIRGKRILRAQVPLGKIDVPRNGLLLSVQGQVQLMDSEKGELAFETCREILVDRSYHILLGWMYLLYYKHF